MGLKSSEELDVLADRVIDVLRSEGLAIAEARDVLKIADENLEWEPLSKVPVIKEKHAYQQIIEWLTECSHDGPHNCKECPYNKEPYEAGCGKLLSDAALSLTLLSEEVKK